MNCFLESIAAAYLLCRAKMIPPQIEEEIYSAQDSLEECKKSMLMREGEFMLEYEKLGEVALKLKMAKDVVGAKNKLVERKRVAKRLEKLRNGLILVESQLDAIKTSELDKEIMLSLKASTTAMKKAGLQAQDAEQVIGELDEHIREMQDVNSVLANPIGLEEDVDLEEEFNALGGESTVKEKREVFEREPSVKVRMELEPILE